MENNNNTVGYIACDPSDGDHIADHDGIIRDSWEAAEKDRNEDAPAVRRVGTDGYLYVD